MHVFDLALQWAVKHHAGQTDKAGRPYLGHICAVVAGVRTDDEKTVAALHDIVEDCDVDWKSLEDVFPLDIVDAVRALTRNEGEDYLNEFIPRCAANPLARAVKLADLRHNSDLSRLDDPTDSDLRRKAKYAQAINALENVEPAK